MIGHIPVEEGVEDIPSSLRFLFEIIPNNSSNNGTEIDDDLPDWAAYNTETLQLLLIFGQESSLGVEGTLSPNSDREFGNVIEIMRNANSDNRNENGAHKFVTQSMLSDEFRPFVTSGLPASHVEDHFLSDFQRILPPANQMTDGADTEPSRFTKKPRYTYTVWQ